jgi:outer membrane protein OmpA-like peptidoglycan-associated protein
MKKITSLLCAVILSAFVFSISAQENDQTVVNKNKSKNNWFISVGGGVSVLQGEQDHQKPVLDRLGYSGELSLGKWFNPYFGARLQATVGALKGFNYVDYKGGVYYLADRTTSLNPIGYNNGDWGKIKRVDDGFWQEFNYGSATFDLMANLTNLFRGYAGEKNIIDVIPYLGGGYIHAVASPTNPTHDGLAGKVGARVNFNLGSKFAIYLEPQAVFASTELDGYEGNRIIDIFGNLLVGIQFNINKDFSTPAESLSREEIDYLNSKINENRFLIENHQTILERQQNLIDKLDKKSNERDKALQQQHQTSTTSSAAASDKLFPDYIYFALNSAAIPTAEQNKIKEVVNYLNANPGSKLLLIGYADKLTGNNSYNLKLSRSRVEAVADELKQQGISSNRLIIEWKGDKEQPFAQNAWNRVVVVVER